MKSLWLVILLVAVTETDGPAQSPTHRFDDLMFANDGSVPTRTGVAPWVSEDVVAYATRESVIVRSVDLREVLVEVPMRIARHLAATSNLLVVGAGSQVTCFDVEDGSEKWQLEKRMSANDIAISPNGKYVAVAGRDCLLLDAKSGKVIAKGKGEGADKICFTRDKKYVVTCSDRNVTFYRLSKSSTFEDGIAVPFSAPRGRFFSFESLDKKHGVMIGHSSGVYRAAPRDEAATLMFEPTDGDFTLTFRSGTYDKGVIVLTKNPAGLAKFWDIRYRDLRKLDDAAKWKEVPLRMRVGHLRPTNDGKRLILTTAFGVVSFGTKKGEGDYGVFHDSTIEIAPRIRADGQFDAYSAFGGGTLQLVRSDGKQRSPDVVWEDSLPLTNVFANHRYFGTLEQSTRRVVVIDRDDLEVHEGTVDSGFELGKNTELFHDRYLILVKGKRHHLWDLETSRVIRDFDANRAAIGANGIVYRTLGKQVHAEQIDGTELWSAKVATVNLRIAPSGTHLIAGEQLYDSSGQPIAKVDGVVRRFSRSGEHAIVHRQSSIGRLVHFVRAEDGTTTPFSVADDSNTIDVIDVDPTLDKAIVVGHPSLPGRTSRMMTYVARRTQAEQK